MTDIKEIVEIVEKRQAIIGRMVAQIGTLEKYKNLRTEAFKSGMTLPPGMPNMDNQQITDRVNRAGKILRDARECYELKKLKELFEQAEKETEV